MSNERIYCISFSSIFNQPVEGYKGCGYMILKLFLAGDVMTGRGIDQILPHPSHPQIYEEYIRDARDYVLLAERKYGKIPLPVSPEYIWGDAFREIQRRKPDVMIVNLETAITTSNDYLPKGINYRMNPGNIDVLKVFGIDAAVVANNHILDWGKEGLMETIEVLEKHHIKPIVAGRNVSEAQRPGIFSLKNGRVAVFGYAHPSSGVLPSWKAEEGKPGINILESLTSSSSAEIQSAIAALNDTSLFTVVSIHWGPNWGYEIPLEFRQFAHRLIEEAGVDLIFGHSSHHFQGLEIFQGKLILYGAGDFINDYEGIGGYEEFRPDLRLMYFPEIDFKTKQLISLTVVPMQTERFRLRVPSEADVKWVFEVLQRESSVPGSFVKEGRDIIWKRRREELRY